MNLILANLTYLITDFFSGLTLPGSGFEAWDHLPSLAIMRPYLFATINLWYAFPLLISVSLVCAATRQEAMGPILQHAIRFAIWVIVFMGFVMLALTLIGWLT